jgi:hypothetical protein
MVPEVREPRRYFFACNFSCVLGSICWPSKPPGHGLLCLRRIHATAANGVKVLATADEKRHEVVTEIVNAKSLPAMPTVAAWHTCFETVQFPHT